MLRQYCQTPGFHQEENYPWHISYMDAYLGQEPNGTTIREECLPSKKWALD